MGRFTFITRQAAFFSGILWALTMYPGIAQNTDADLRVNFFRFVLTISPSNVISCNNVAAESVRNVAEDCLQTLATTVCSDVFVTGAPEQILLGGTECRGDDGVVVLGGAMDFPVMGAPQDQVNQCVLQVLTGSECFSSFQAAFPGLQGLIYSVDTPQPTRAPITPTASPTHAPTLVPTFAPSTQHPTLAPTLAPTLPPSSTPTNSPSFTPTQRPSLRPSGSPTTAAPVAVPPATSTVSPTNTKATTLSPQQGNSSDDQDDRVVGGIGDNDQVQPRSSAGGSLGVYVGAAAGGFCLILLLILFAARRQKSRQEQDVSEVKVLDLAEQPKGGLRTCDSLHPEPVLPPPGILHNSSPRTASRVQSQLFHALPDDDYSAPGTSIGDPDLTLISSVDMGSMDGSESFVDQNRSFSVNISKDMLGGTSEVPKNRNAVLSRLGASLTPVLVMGSSRDEGDSPPSPPSRRTKMGGFQKLSDDEDDGTDEELLLDISDDDPEPIQTEDFSPDMEWDPDDNTDEGTDDDDMFRDHKAAGEDFQSGAQLPVPPELRDSTRRKPRSSTPRSVLGGSSGHATPSVASSSSGSTITSESNKEEV